MKKLLVGLGIASALVLAGCGDDNSSEKSSDEKSYSEAVDYTITGIEPGAGISVTTEKAIDEYESLSGWTVELSSTAAMAAELDKAIDNEEPIVITGWNPHWTFAKYPDMKYLEDPKGIYGDVEEIKTIVRKGLREEKPEAFKLLNQFNWEVEDMEGIMYESKESGNDIATVAKQWVADNQGKVDEWLEGVNEVEGVEIELVSTPWDSERASANVVKYAMEQRGFEVTITPVDVAVVFESIANGDGDASLAPWMPITHKDFYESYQEDFVDLGANLVGAKIGLVVPAYMDIKSIDDLEPKD
ncbi:glycine betaine ABC transporter substrate-binding protein [Paucisalibacillus sp. EB02]|uniref:glycine betaine ABC transporter substrate-binding protein n=1 Tax=Paucisalibacillus sp. EB02 TaxID=1347087 RepID=UPI0005A9545B|nr:glycine betaine ABC transporter substrate-binding protein [Paucisalibacillus sp. EB02]